MPDAAFPALDATLCISVASRPGRFGVAVHNAGYRALGLNFQYKAFRIVDIGGAMAGVRALGIRGCGVSMPFKETVIPHLDALDPAAAAVGAVNTVVNDEGVLTGWNTDVVGVEEALRPLLGDLDEPVTVLGAGGMARATVYAMRRLGLRRITICARQRAAAEALAARFSVAAADWESRLVAPRGLLFNATCVGMAPDITESPIPDSALNGWRVVADAVASPAETALLRAAHAVGASTIDGPTISLHQACAQFRLYTGCEPPRDAMRRAAGLE